MNIELFKFVELNDKYYLYHHDNIYQLAIDTPTRINNRGTCAIYLNDEGMVNLSGTYVSAFGIRTEEIDGIKNQRHLVKGQIRYNKNFDDNRKITSELNIFNKLSNTHNTDLVVGIFGNDEDTEIIDNYYTTLLSYNNALMIQDSLTMIESVAESILPSNYDMDLKKISLCDAILLIDSFCTPKVNKIKMYRSFANLLGVNIISGRLFPYVFNVGDGERLDCSRCEWTEFRVGDDDAAISLLLTPNKINISTKPNGLFMYQYVYNVDKTAIEICDCVPKEESGTLLSDIPLVNSVEYTDPDIDDIMEIYSDELIFIKKYDDISKHQSFIFDRLLENNN